MCYNFILLSLNLKDLEPLQDDESSDMEEEEEEDDGNKTSGKKSNVMEKKQKVDVLRVTGTLKLSRRELYKPPTSEELNQLKETENLFHSSLLRMQVHHPWCYLLVFNVCSV